MIDNFDFNLVINNYFKIFLKPLVIYLKKVDQIRDKWKSFSNLKMSIFGIKKDITLKFVSFDR